MPSITEGGEASEAKGVIFSCFIRYLYLSNEFVLASRTGL